MTTAVCNARPCPQVTVVTFREPRPSLARTHTSVRSRKNRRQTFRCHVHWLFADMQFRSVKPIDHSWPPLILLHGSGGTEVDMLTVAAVSAPGFAEFSLRGAVSWEGGYAFFERFPDRRINEDSLRAEAPALAAFVNDRVTSHFERKPILVGFSNGAIMAAALLMLFPGSFEGAALLRPLSPFATPPQSQLPATPALLIDALNDARRAPGDGIEMASQLLRSGAVVTHRALRAGHSLSEGDLSLLKAWLGERR